MNFYLCHDAYNYGFNVMHYLPKKDIALHFVFDIGLVLLFTIGFVNTSIELRLIIMKMLEY